MSDFINELQQKRADNIIWNSAADYSFRPDFKAYDGHGQADIYWNVIIGSARKHYDYPQFEKLFECLDEECQDMFWTALEKLIYPKEVINRPVLELLREEHESPFTLHPDMTTEEIVEAARGFFAMYHQGKKPKKKFNLLGIQKKKVSQYHSFLNSGLMWHPSNIYGTAQGQDPNQELATKLSEEELRLFMQNKYGRPMFNARQTAEKEKELCRDNHQNCHLLFTYGDRVDASAITNGFEALARQREAEQVAENKASYQLNIQQNRLAISKLAGNIQNSVLLHLQPTDVRSKAGTIDSALAWRAAVLDDNRVFQRKEQNNLGDFCVDILLDASTSQTNRQTTISAQAFIIAESMKKCGIPCRVISFCSMTGYTILRVFKNNNDIFEYVSNGCNRDGLAIRAAHHLINMEHSEHKMLIVLSDVKPNDVIKIENKDTQERIPYEKKAGLYDTAFEVRKCRADGISVVCIFTGDDEDVSSAAMVYGRDFVRIKSFDLLADTVGKLIKNQIKNL